MNRSEDKLYKEQNPRVTASLLSRMTFWWTRETFKIGQKRAIEEHEIYEVLDDLRSDKITNGFSAAWAVEKQKKAPNVLRTIQKLYGTQLIIWNILFLAIEISLEILQTICVGGLVSYFVPGQTEFTEYDAFIYATGVVLSSILLISFFHPLMLWIFCFATKVRVGLSGLIYQKVLRVTKSSTDEDGLGGNAMNLLSNDSMNIERALVYMHEIFRGPFETIIFAYFIYLELGAAGLIGVAFLISMVPLQAWISKKSAELRLKAAQRTDIRVRIMNEIILGIHVIKMYAWEKSFAAMVDKIRKQEVKALRGIANVRATVTSFTVLSKISLFIALASYVYFGNSITARKVFIVSLYFNLLNISMVFFWPVGLTRMAEAYISFKRIQEFLLKPEEKPSANNNFISTKHFASKEIFNNSPIITPKRVINLNTIEKSISFQGVSAAWASDNALSASGIFNIDLEIHPNSLCAIVGHVGSGKSSLLNVILDELQLDEGQLNINGSISYANQEAWLFEGSVRDNIIFVEDFDERRYWEVVHVCALERDLKLLPNGDESIVGERGSRLSGGQRARINLARAIYKKADIYLLDDPLSAVDAHVGKHIFEKCIRDYLCDKIVILVTHQLQYLQNLQQIVILNNGRIEAQGSYQQIRESNRETILSINAMEMEHKADSKDARRKSSIISLCDEINFEDLIDRKETQETGGINYDVYKMFLQAVGSPSFVIIVLIAFILAQIGISGASYFISQWVNWEEQLVMAKEHTGNISNDTLIEPNLEYETETRETYLIVYAVIMALGTAIFIYRSFGFFHLCLRTSVNLHDKLFRGIARAQMVFFNTNPSGRILNRFARDIGNVDFILPTTLLDCIDFVMNLVGILIIVGIVNYWLIIPTVVMLIVFYWMRNYYIWPARSLKRIEAITRSPLYAHLNATIQGLSTVRSFGAESNLEQEFHAHQDHSTSAWYLFTYTSRAFALWLDMTCMAFVACVTYSFLVLPIESESGNVGLAILSSINLVYMCQWGLRQSAELENQMISVERVMEYANEPSEAALETEKDQQPPNDWPTNGAIEFSSLTLRYVTNGSEILKNLSFNIQAKEKIGIVGRTGAGKSSIIQALFRLATNEGRILIDGIDIGRLGLHDLRKSVSIIPQDPVLFSGTLRFNLDPFEERTDVEMWNALAQVELMDMVSSLGGGLDCRMLDGGCNFSMGQRQLVCLARAILRNNRILILDEATANVDPETDKLIQNTIRDQFLDCTVLTIAHRLHTVMDYDKILVLDAGEIAEYGRPYELLQIPNGVFRKLVAKTGSATARTLMQAAKQSHEKATKLE